MPDAGARAARASWRLLAAAGVCTLALAAVVAAGWGFSWSAGGFLLRVHQPWRLLAAGAGLIGLAIWLGGAQARAALERTWEDRDRPAAGWIAAAAAAAVMAVGLVKGVWVAGSADAYGYVSQAQLWLKGLPVKVEPLSTAASSPLTEWSFSPLGYRPGVEAGTIVATYPPGLPLVMAAASAAGGPDAVYWVVPLLGAATVWLTFIIGRRYTGTAAGAAAAVLLATSPVFLFQLVQPMSDVPVTAWWLLSLWGATAGLPVVAGTGAAAAVLTRPNLVPVAGLVMAAVLFHAYRRARTAKAVLRAFVGFAAPVGVAVGFLLWLNARLYGSPLQSGYGDASGLFALANVPLNAGRYTRWLIETQTPVVLLGLLAPFVAAFTRRGFRARSDSALASWFALGFIGVVLACYLPYVAFEDWWYLRFLLPALPVLLMLTAAALVHLVSRMPRGWSAAAFVTIVTVVAATHVVTARDRSALDLEDLESRYLEAGSFASRELPVNAILLSVQESGPLRLYGGRPTVRFDHVDPQGLDAAVEFLARAGYRPYFVLEAWEEAQFRDRFSRSTALGLLDWPPMAEVGRAVKVRFYDPLDRQRFLAGEPLATARNPIENRDRR